MATGSAPDATLAHQPPELVDALAQRLTLYDRLDAWEGLRQRINELVSRVPAEGSTHPQQPTEENAAPNELREQLQGTLEQMAARRTEIEALEAQIQKVRDNVIPTIIGMVAGGIIVLLVLVTILSAVF